MKDQDPLVQIKCIEFWIGRVKVKLVRWHICLYCGFRYVAS
jgi:hypothetical protein